MQSNPATVNRPLLFILSPDSSSHHAPPSSLGYCSISDRVSSAVLTSHHPSPHQKANPKRAGVARPGPSLSRAFSLFTWSNHCPNVGCRHAVKHIEKASHWVEKGFPAQARAGYLNLTIHRKGRIGHQPKVRIYSVKAGFTPKSADYLK